jgi:transposase
LLNSVRLSKESNMEQLLSSRAVDWREGRRLRAWELHEAGWTQAQIAEALGVTPGAVSQWMRRGRDGGGIAALNKRTAPGAACKLSAEQRAQILTWLDEGAPAHGFSGELWTRRRIAALIERKLGVHYHPGHVSKLLQAWKWSPQKPALRATQRDEEAIEQWCQERWPAIKKSGTAGGPQGGVRR